MLTLENKKYADGVTRFDILFSALNVEPRGMSLDEMQERMELIKTLKDGRESDSLDFNNDRIELIKKTFMNFRGWTIVSKAVLETRDYLNALHEKK